MKLVKERANNSYKIQFSKFTPIESYNAKPISKFGIIVRACYTRLVVNSVADFRWQSFAKRTNVSSGLVALSFATMFTLN
jgi:hypothetical protein